MKRSDLGCPAHYAGITHPHTGTLVWPCAPPPTSPSVSSFLPSALSFHHPLFLDARPPGLNSVSIYLMIRRPTAGKGIKLVRASSRIISHWAVRVRVGTRAGNGHRVSNHYSSTWKHRNAATRPSPCARRLPRSSLRTNLRWNILGSIPGAHGNSPLLIGFPRKVSRRFIPW